MNHHPHPKQAIYEGCAIQENGPPTLGHCMDRHDKNKSMRCITVHHHVRMLYKTTLHCELPITAHTSSGSIVALWCYQKESLIG
mmetsp:Transcript_74022/g.135506  ORF Transcript_74022/g.135506 Transcript_74022/m.135506 type:complete len:84 (-) Transcript_74022:1175-1426(-)